MARDPLKTLLRLHELEIWQAQYRLAEHLSLLSGAEAQKIAAQATLQAERACGPADFADWLPRGLRDVDLVQNEIERQKSLVENSQESLRGHKIQQKITKQLLEKKELQYRDQIAKKFESDQDLLKITT